MNNSKVTIVVPTYNADKYIEETIQSCINQTHKNINIIAIDDNSKDNTVKLLKKFGSSITIIENLDNNGLPRNINQVILNDDSDFFIYLGHDDVIPNDHVSLMLTEFDHDVVAVHCNSKIMNNKSEIFNFTKNNRLQFIKTSRIPFELALNNFISIIGMMHRTKAFQSIGGWDSSYDLYGEWLYYINISAVGKIKYSTKSYAFYRHHDSNIYLSLYDKERMNSFFTYKKRCRLLAYSKCKNLSVHNKVSFFITRFIDFLRTTKIGQLIKYFKYCITYKT